MKPALKKPPIVFRCLPKSEQGFAALIGVIILSAVIVALSVALNAAQFLKRAAIADTGFKIQSRILADSCVQVAVLRLIQNSDYAPPAEGEIIRIGAKPEESCLILSVTGDGQKTVRTKAEDHRAVTNLEAMISIFSGTVSMLSTRETAAF